MVFRSAVFDELDRWDAVDNYLLRQRSSAKSLLYCGIMGVMLMMQGFQRISEDDTSNAGEII